MSTLASYSSVRTILETNFQSAIDKIELSESWPGKFAKTETNADTSTFINSPPIQIVWYNVILLLAFHVAAIYGVYLMFTSAMWQSNLFVLFLHMLSVLGITAGVHRLWCHRSYKAKLPLRIFLAFASTVAYQNAILHWARDHRVHHKYSETDADPHNAKRGFFFSHVGWTMCRKHPDVTRLGKDIDLNDLLADPVVRFQKKFYGPLVLLCCFILPTIVPMYVWGESFLNAFFIQTVLRYCLGLNVAWFVNSVGHMWGYRPYDVHIYPRDNPFLVFATMGEGFHNFHHAFPYDYSTSEFGLKFNLTTIFIDIMAMLGQVYDRKTASKNSISARKLRSGPHRVQNVTNDSKKD